MNLNEYANAFLARGGFVLDDELTLGVVAWAAAENSRATFNPLDTTQPGVAGATPYNTIRLPGGRLLHVWNYPSLEAGIDATLATLRNGRYGAVLTVLHDQAAKAEQLAAAVGRTPWGTGDFTGTVADVRANRAAYFGRLLAGTNPAAARPLLREGARSLDVASAQRLLNAHGAHLATDGIFGPLTAAAVRAFQQAHHLAVDAIIGPLTWAALSNG